MPITDKRPLKVFLCHAHADRDPVRGLYTRLTKDGVDAWLDKAKLLPGQDWELEIRKAVREADVVVVCLSKQFNQAGFRQKEVRLALDTAMEQPEGEIFIIPARLEECDTLESLRKWHWVDLFEEDGYERLMQALRVRANKIGVTLQIKKNRLKVITLPDQKPNKATTEYNFISKLRKSGESKEEFMERYRATMFRISLVGLIAVISYIVIFAPNFISQLNNSPEIVFTPSTTTHAATITPIPASETKTPELSIAPTRVPTIIPTVLPTEITDAKGVSMALVPAGEFIMGNNNSREDERPTHVVYLDSYYIDKYEVTNSLYKACVDAGECSPPRKKASHTRPNYYGNPEFDQYPVIFVDWSAADNYCSWRDARLPTESEWERAARGTDSRTYPWGEDIDCKKASFESCVGDTTKVGSYENGKSPYNIYDMAGNVTEWVSDWYQKDYYSLLEENVHNPLGPDNQYLNKVVRGGSWYQPYLDIRTFRRDHYFLNYDGIFIGFRCAMDVAP